MRIDITVDPQNVYWHISQEDMFESLGLIPHMLLAAEADTLDKALEEKYDFFTNWSFDNFTVTDEGTFKYPGDEDLVPLAKYTFKDDVMYQYQYGIIVTKVNGKWAQTRAD